MARLNQVLEMIKQTPDDPFLHFALAQEYQRIDEQEKALECFAWLIENKPNYTGTYYHYGKLLQQQGRTEQALDIYRRGIAVCQQQGARHDQLELQGALNDLEDLLEE